MSADIQFRKLVQLHFIPVAAKDYVRFIEDEVECPASIISTGPRREETIVLD